MRSQKSRSSKLLTRVTTRTCHHDPNVHGLRLVSRRKVPVLSGKTSAKLAKDHPPLKSQNRQRSLQQPWPIPARLSGAFGHLNCLYSHIEARIPYNRSFYPRPAPRASSPDIFANRSTDSIRELNPELQQLAKKVRKNNTRAGSEAASGKPEIVAIRVVYHPHPQDPSDRNPNKSWAFKMKRVRPLWRTI